MIKNYITLLILGIVLFNAYTQDTASPIEFITKVTSKSCEFLESYTEKIGDAADTYNGAYSDSDNCYHCPSHCSTCTAYNLCTKDLCYRYYSYVENGLFDNSATKVPKCMPCNLGADSGREAISGVRKCAYYKGDESAITLKVAQKYRWLHATSCQNGFTKIGGNCQYLNQCPEENFTIYGRCLYCKVGQKFDRLGDSSFKYNNENCSQCKNTQSKSQASNNWYSSNPIDIKGWISGSDTLTKQWDGTSLWGYSGYQNVYAFDTAAAKDGAGNTIQVCSDCITDNQCSICNENYWMATNRLRSTFDFHISANPSICRKCNSNCKCTATKDWIPCSECISGNYYLEEIPTKNQGQCKLCDSDAGTWQGCTGCTWISATQPVKCGGCKDGYLPYQIYSTKQGDTNQISLGTGCIQHMQTTQGPTNYAKERAYYHLNELSSLTSNTKDAPTELTVDIKAYTEASTDKLKTDIANLRALNDYWNNNLGDPNCVKAQILTISKLDSIANPNLDIPAEFEKYYIPQVRSCIDCANGYAPKLYYFNIKVVKNVAGGSNPTTFKGIQVDVCVPCPDLMNTQYTNVVSSYSGSNHQYVRRCKRTSTATSSTTEAWEATECGTSLIGGSSELYPRGYYQDKSKYDALTGDDLNFRNFLYKFASRATDVPTDADYTVWKNIEYTIRGTRGMFFTQLITAVSYNFEKTEVFQHMKALLEQQTLMATVLLATGKTGKMCLKNIQWCYKLKDLSSILYTTAIANPNCEKCYDSSYQKWQTPSRNAYLLGQDATNPKCLLCDLDYCTLCTVVKDQNNLQCSQCYQGRDNLSWASAVNHNTYTTPITAATIELSNYNSYLDTSFKCQVCSKGCKECVAGGCNSCMAGFFDKTGSEVGKKTCSDICLAKYCKNCNGDTNDIKLCQECFPGYFRQVLVDTKSSICVACTFGCASCDSRKTCKQCADGYIIVKSPKEGNTYCLPYREGCVVYDPSTGVCSQCGYGYRLKTSGGFCYKCKDQAAGFFECPQGGDMNSLDYSKTNTKKAAVATRVLSSHIAFDFLDNDDQI